MPINPANRGTYCDKDKQHGKNWTTTVLSRLLAAVRDSFHPKLAWLCHVAVPSLILGIPQSNKMQYILHPARSCYIFGRQWPPKHPDQPQWGFLLQLICHHFLLLIHFINSPNVICLSSGLDVIEWVTWSSLQRRAGAVQHLFLLLHRLQTDVE